MARKPQAAELTPEQMHYVRHRKRVRWLAHHTVLFIIALAIFIPVNNFLEAEQQLPMIPFVVWGLLLAVHALYAIGFFGAHR